MCGAAELTSDVRSQLVASAVVQQLLLRTEHPQSQPAAGAPSCSAVEYSSTVAAAAGVAGSKRVSMTHSSYRNRHALGRATVPHTCTLPNTETLPRVACCGARCIKRTAYAGVNEGELRTPRANYTFIYTL